jgi:putative spermidine/putrescine transport system substrate-binding protein
MQGHIIGALAGLLAAGLAAGSASAGEITFTSWGGSYAKAQLDTAVKPFSSRSGTVVKMEEYAGGLDEVRRQVGAGRVQWDVVDLTIDDALRACDDGLLEKIDPDKLAPGVQSEPARKDYLPGTLTDCVAGTIVYSTVFAFNAKSYPDKRPQSVADVFDTAGFPGKRGLRRSAEGNLEWALMADGVPVEQVYAVLSTRAGVDRAFRKLSALKPHVVWWKGATEPLQQLESGAVQMASSYNGRIYAAVIRQDKPYRYLWDGQLLSSSGLGIVKGTRNRADAEAFIRFATQPNTLAAMAPLTAYGPTRISAERLLDPVMLQLLPTASWYRKRSLTVDARWWSMNGKALNERFEAWLAQ